MLGPTKISYNNGIGFNGAETNCGIAHILGLLINTCDFLIFRATTISGLSSLN